MATISDGSDSQVSEPRPDVYGQPSPPAPGQINQLLFLTYLHT
jgi:hypothetical protein